MNAALLRFRDLAWFLTIAGVTVIGCILYWLSLLGGQAAELETAREHSELRAKQLNEAAAQQLDATVRSIDTALRYLRTVYVEDRRNFDHTAKDVLAAYPQGMLQFITVFGQDGYLAYSSNPTSERLFFGDREHFRIHADSDEDRLFVSKPIIGRIANVPLIQVTRVIRDGKQFLGVIGIPIRPAYLSDNLKALRVDSTDLLSIVRLDGTLIARSHDLDEGLKSKPLLERPFIGAQAGQRGLFRSPSAVGKAPFLFSWQRLSAWPLIAVAAINEEAELGPLNGRHDEQRRNALLTMAVVLAFALAIAALVMSTRRKNRELVQSGVEHMKSIARLHTSEEKFAKAFRSNPMFISISTVAEGRYIDVNENFLGKIGRTREEVIGHTAHEIALWKNPSDRQRAVDSLKENGHISNFEAELCNKSGESIFSEIWAEPLLIEDVPCIIWVSNDITERKLNEGSLRASEERNRTLLAVSPDGIWIHKNGKIEYLNDALVEMLGYGSTHDFVGRTIYEFFAPEFREALRERVTNVAATLARAPLTETVMLRQDGSRLEVETTASAFQQGEVIRNVSIIREITARKMAEEKIAKLAFFDQLTGLANRTLLLDRLKQAMAASSRSGQHGALLFIDLDNFKTLNDTLGHDMGDMLLKQVAQRLMLCVREGDTVARVGGDEFLVVLAGLSTGEEYAATDIETVTEKILAALNQPYQLGNLPHRSTASIGVTLFSGDSTAIDDLMKQADLAMYKSKAAGRNLVRFFDPTLESAVKERAALEDDLRRALLVKQFLLYYQAQVDDYGHCTGAEVLIRWQHPQRGMVLPADFIPLAEDTGLILPIGHWVLQTACAQLAAWAAYPETAGFNIAVNVSARQFHHPDFVDQVLAVLEETGADPLKLKLELTESLLVDDVPGVIAKMSVLKEKGVGFSLDDFGTGYSSLSSLKRLPLDQLKIDQGFVRDILTDPNDAAIAKMTIALAASMGLAVIAEGVEIEAQRDFLARHGCHAFQGYLFSRPVPLEEFSAFANRV